MKRISVKSIVKHSLLISAFAVSLAGCAAGDGESQNSESTPIAASAQNEATSQQTPVGSTQSQTPATSLPTETINVTEPTEDETLVAAGEESDLGANLEKVYFQFDSYALTPRAKEKLLPMAQSLKNNSQLSLQIKGYTDEIGTEEYNFNLGKMRAQAVKEYLVAQGVNPQVLSTISYGEKNPAMKGSNSGAWQQNRRVEFTIMP